VPVKERTPFPEGLGPWKTMITEAFSIFPEPSVATIGGAEASNSIRMRRWISAV
jgi:hypothetical protein